MIDTAIILAGGFGTRLQSVVSDVPKPMAPVNGEPFLNYQLLYLKHYGVKNIILSVGHLHEKIENYYGTDFKELNISYVVEKQALGTGGGIRLALEHCNAEYVLALNGDSFFGINLQDFCKQHCDEKATFSLALRRVEDASRYGTILTNNLHNVISFKEKSGKQEAGTINAGMYILNKNVFLEHTPSGQNFSIEKDFFETKTSQLAIKGFEAEGYFIDIGIPEDYNKAQSDFKEFKYR
jgi:D-glycero-alpha-D-manno-heptose 1-phosphate guanylyltransferase